VIDADLVIGAVLVPGARAPQLLTEELIGRMEKGSVVVDVAVDQGGCIATCRPTTHDHPTYEVHGVVRHPGSDGGTRPEAARTLSLRESGDQVTDGLVAKLRERLEVAGVTIDEAWINHLAYAPEIAPVMLRRQQASAVIAARKLVVAGAVDIVKEALEKLREETDIDLDPERKAAMVSNLLVVLVSDKDATPVVNTGTLYA